MEIEHRAVAEEGSFQESSVKQHLQSNVELQPSANLL